MKQVLKAAYTALITMLISAFGIVGHTSAMPMTDPGHTQHPSAASASCSSICIGVPADKKQAVPSLGDEDDEPQPPYYLQFKSAQTSWIAEKNLVPRIVEQPGEVPRYQLCCSIRR